MQKDFHYYCIGVLARAAGFNCRDALNVAYASQYVDDSTESELIRLKIDGEGLKFDPVCTSYSGLETIQSLDWSAQKRVWIPFHFIPSKPFDPQESQTFSFVTAPDSPFARLLLKQAASEPLKNRQRRLCRIGVALHTYADTWSHQSFSGRKSRAENDVEGIHEYDPAGDRWRHLGIENLIFDALPQIGHAEVGFFPDLAYQRWKCTLGSAKREHERDNVQVFLQAARAIYDRLCAMKKSDAVDSIPWEELEPKIGRLFAGRAVERAALLDQLTLPAYRAYQALDVQKRCDAWEKEFAYLFEPHPEAFSYDREAWRKDALEGDTDWDDYDESDWNQMLPRGLRPGFWDSLWVHFHRAALRQRHFVLENLP
jgi:hypothetical protein